VKTIFGVPWIRYLTPLVLWLVAAGYVALAATYGREARMMPLLVGGLLVILVPLDIVSLSDTAPGRWLRHSLNPAAASEPEAEAVANWRPRLVAVAWMLGLPLLIYLVGVVAATFIYVAGSLRALGRKRWRTAVGTGLAAAAVGYLLLQVLLGIPLYEGLLAILAQARD
jgi:hypothetical protein